MSQNKPIRMLFALILLGMAAACVPVTGSDRTPTSPPAASAPAKVPTTLPVAPTLSEAATPQATIPIVVITPAGFATSGPAVTSQPGNAEPTGSPVSPTLAPPGTPLVVTRQNAGQTLSMHVGDRFVLMLGEGFDWTVNISDQAVLHRVVNITPLRGSQGVYEALKTGSTGLTAVGDPLCRQSKPACGMPSISFEINITVVP